MDTVNIGSNVEYNAFKNIEIITSVKFGSKCTSVGIDAFNGCISLDKINDDNVIEKIYGGAFANTKLSSVAFRKLKDIGGDGAFENCSYLTNINIQNCKNIPQNTFCGCDNLTDINIQSCTHIGLSAFYICKNLKNVKLKLNGNTISVNSTAFYGCENLKNIDFRNCSHIGDNAFAGCTSIENARLNKCITIGNYAFNGCTNLKKINLASCMIGDSAFFGCKNLSEVYINTTPSQRRISLGSYVFYYKNNNSEGGPSWGKNGLHSQESTYSIISNIRFYLGVDIFNSYYTDPNWSIYKDYMFKLPGDNQILYTTENNEQIDIDSNKYGGISLHTYYNNIISIEFNKSIDKLDQKIFKNNEAITSIYLPSNCKLIGDNEFEGCISLDTFTPSPLDVLKTIGNCSFKDCTSLKSFTIPKSVTKLGEGIFAGCKNIEKFEGNFVKYNGKAIVYNNTLISVAPKDNSENGGRYYKISEIDSNIKSLGKYCFSWFSELMRVDMITSHGTTYIGDFAFEGCDNLREVHFYGGYPSGSIEFGENAFGIFKKDENEDYVVNKNKNYFKIFIPENSFSSCLDEENNSTNSWIKVYKKYIYPEPSNKHIIYYKNTLPEDNKNYHLIEINIGEIKIDSFRDNINNISKIIIGEEITKINASVFKSCENLEDIYLPNSLEIIGSSVFQGCKKLNYISIPNNVEAIGQYCFGNSGIKEFNINYGSKLRKISRNAFINCSNLITVNLLNAQKLESIDTYTFYFCENLTNVVLSNTITSIEDYAFAGCKSLSRIYLPKGLKNLGHNCLATGTSNTKIYIPNYDNGRIPIFTIGGRKSENSYPFGDPEGPKVNIPMIYVPEKSYDNYISDKFWGKYKNKINKYNDNQIESDVDSDYFGSDDNPSIDMT